MPQKHWVVVAPLLVLLGIAGSLGLNPILTRGADPRIADERLFSLERELGYHLYAPTWLPHEGTVGVQGAVRGRVRILQDFLDNQDRTLCILSQEVRRKERDDYHERIFIKKSEATIAFDGKTAHFVTGNGGERRLFWNETDRAIILSSSILSDEDLGEIARKVH